MKKLLQIATILFSIVQLATAQTTDFNRSVTAESFESILIKDVDIQELNMESFVLVMLQDVTGKELFSVIELKESEEDPVFAIDPEHAVPPGVYMITAASENHFFKRRVVIRG